MLGVVKFHEKLRRRVQELQLNKSRAARDAGLPESTISSYLAKSDSLPRIDIALKIANAIKVPLAWLADDSQDFPVPSAAKASPALFSDDELMMEVARRYRQFAIHLRSVVNALKLVNWPALAMSLYETPVGAELQPEAKKSVDSLSRAAATITFAEGIFDPRVYAEQHPDQVPSGQFSAAELNIDKTLQEWRDYVRSQELAGLVDLYMRWLKPGSVNDAETARRVDEMRLQFLEQLKSGFYPSGIRVEVVGHAPPCRAESFGRRRKTARSSLRF